MKKKGNKAKHFWPAFDFEAFLLLYFELAGGRLSANRLRLMYAACVCVCFCALPLAFPYPRWRWHWHLINHGQLMAHVRSHKKRVMVMAINQRRQHTVLPLPFSFLTILLPLLIDELVLLAVLVSIIWLHSELLSNETDRLRLRLWAWSWQSYSSSSSCGPFSGN